MKRKMKAVSGFGGGRGVIPEKWRNHDVAEIRFGWSGTGRRGTVLGPAIDLDGQSWVPIRWDEEEDPDWHKEAGLWWVHGPRDVINVRPRSVRRGSG